MRQLTIATTTATTTKGYLSEANEKKRIRIPVAHWLISSYQNSKYYYIRVYIHRYGSATIQQLPFSVSLLFCAPGTYTGGDQVSEIRSGSDGPQCGPQHTSSSSYCLRFSGDIACRCLYTDEKSFPASSGVLLITSS